MTSAFDGAPVVRRSAASSIVPILSVVAIIGGVAAVALNRNSVEFGYYLYEPLGYMSSRSTGFTLLSPTGIVLAGIALVVVGAGVLGFFLGERAAQRRAAASARAAATVTTS